MPAALSDERWLAIRELCEGGLPTHPRVAAAAGIGSKSISKRVGEEKWKTLDFRFKRVSAAHRAMVALADALRAGHEVDEIEEEPAVLAEAPVEEPLSSLPPAERIARMGAILARRTEAMLMKVEAGRPIEGRQVAALSSLVQLSERIAALAREEAGRTRAQDDLSLADTLRRIDDRIVELACEGTRFILVHRCGIDPAWVEEHLPEDQRRGTDDVVAPDPADLLPAPMLAAGGTPPSKRA